MTRHTVELTPALAELAQWLQAQVDEHDFAQVGGTIIVHKGEITRVIRRSEISLVPDNKGARHARPER